MRIRPTELGIKGMLLLAALEVAFLAASYSNLFFLLIAFCCVLGGLGLWWAHGNLRGVQIELGDVPLAAAGTTRSLPVLLRTGRRQRFDLAVEVLVDGTRIELGHTTSALGDLPMTGQLPAWPRGVQTVRRVSLVSRFPFGFFSWRRDLPSQAEVITHPAPCPADASGARRQGAAHHFASTGQRSATVAGLRAFRSGDALSDVHWRATARRGTAIVKEREREHAPGVEVVLDRRCSADELETALGITTELLYSARAAERPLLVSSQDFVMSVGGGRNDDRPLLRWLAETTTLPASAANPPAGGPGCLRLPTTRRPEGSRG